MSQTTSKTMPKTILSAENITAGYVPDLNILSECGIELKQGELIGIIGPNGAGKSTLLKVIFRLLAIREGNIQFAEKDIAKLETHTLVSLGIAYIPQIENVFPNLSVEDNLKMGAYLDSGLVKPQMKKVFELFPKLIELRQTRASQLSGGEAQMVAIGRALMMNPKIILLDEPSAGLSPANQKIAFDSIKEVVASGVSAIMVEQNARTCLEICDRVYVLENGRNAFTDTGENLANNPKVIELYLGSLGATDSKD